MASHEYTQLRKVLRPGLADPEDPIDVVRRKMHDIHPTRYPDDVRVERLELGGVPAAWVSTPEVEGADRAVFMVHGGAFVSTGIAHYIPYAARLSRHVRARLLLHEYRLAPEHPFPAALEDTVAVYRAALERGVSAERIAFLGDSCGGGIALAALLTLRDAGDPLPAACVGLSPWLDLEVTGDSAHEPRGVDPYLDPQWVRNRGRDYAGADGDLRDPLVSPLHADLTGLPPLLLSVGEIDLMRDDSTRLAARAGRDGVAVTLEVNPEMIHGFHGLSDLFPESRQALERVGEFVRRHVS